MVCVRESRAQAAPHSFMHSPISLRHAGCFFIIPAAGIKKRLCSISPIQRAAVILFPSKTADGRALFFLLKFSLPRAALLFVYVSEPRERSIYTCFIRHSLHTRRESCRVSIFNAYPSDQINNSASAEKQI
jgi:hypothetical protein